MWHHEPSSGAAWTGDGGGRVCHSIFWAGGRTWRWEQRWRRFSWIAFLLLLPLYALASFIPTLGSQPLWLGVTLYESVRVLIYTLVGVRILYALVPPYWRVCRTPPPVWWQRAILLGVLLAAAGLASAGLIALLHQQLGDALGLPLYSAGLALSAVGLGVFAAGNFGLARAIRRQQRQQRRADASTLGHLGH